MAITELDIDVDAEAETNVLLAIEAVSIEEIATLATGQNAAFTTDTEAWYLLPPLETPKGREAASFVAVVDPVDGGRRRFIEIDVFTLSTSVAQASIGKSWIIGYELGRTLDGQLSTRSTSIAIPMQEPITEGRILELGDTLAEIEFTTDTDPNNRSRPADTLERVETALGL